MILGLVAGIIFLYPYCAQASGIGMGPVSIDIDNALRNIDYPNTVFVYSSYEDDITLALEVKGSCAEWVSLYEEGGSSPLDKVTIPPMGNKKLTAKIHIPEFAEAGSYECTIYAKQNIEAEEGEQVLAIRVKSDISIWVVGSELPKGTVGGLSINNPYSGSPLLIDVDFQNIGNVIAKPKIISEITRNGKIIDRFTHEKTTIEPGEATTISIERSTEGWELGDYNMTMRFFLSGIIFERSGLFFKMIEQSGEEFSPASEGGVFIDGTYENSNDGVDDSSSDSSSSGTDSTESDSSDGQDNGERQNNDGTSSEENAILSMIPTGFFSHEMASGIAIAIAIIILFIIIRFTYKRFR